jgi:hypothetical protein
VVVDGDVPNFVFGVVLGVAPAPTAPDGVVDGDVLSVVFGVTPPGPVVPGAPPLFASVPLPV